MKDKLKNLQKNPDTKALSEMQKSVLKAKEQADKLKAIIEQYGSVANYRNHLDMVKRGVNV